MLQYAGHTGRAGQGRAGSCPMDQDSLPSDSKEQEASVAPGESQGPAELGLAESGPAGSETTARW